MRFDRKIIEAVMKGVLGTTVGSGMRELTERRRPIIVAVTALDAIVAIAN